MFCRNCLNKNIKSNKKFSIIFYVFKNKLFCKCNICGGTDISLI